MLPTPISQDSVVSRHLLRQAAELVHVARARGVLHRAGGQKQPSLEESVIQAMQQAGGNGQRRADADAHHHVADLAHRREGQHALQIGLHHGVHHAHGHGDGADPHQGFTSPGEASVHCGHAPKLCIRQAR